MKDSMPDLRRTLRGMAQRPGLHLVVAITLGLGIGANATMYGLVKRLLLSAPPHIAAPERVFQLRFDEAQSGGNRIVLGATSYPAYEAMRAGLASVADIVAYRGTLLTVSEPRAAQAESVTALAVSSHYFDVLGVSAERGSLPSGTWHDDDEPWVVISYGLWRSRFDAAEDIIGRTLIVGHEERRIVGVTPRGFTGTALDPVDAWLGIAAPLPGVPSNWRSLDQRAVFLVARLRDGARAQDLSREATLVYRATQADRPGRSDDPNVIAATLVPGRGSDGVSVTSDARVSLWLQAVACLVLLIALFNVLNIFLVRVIERQRETAISMALGITPWRLIRLSGMEYLAATSLGAGVAVLFVRFVAPRIWLLVLPSRTDIDMLAADVFSLTAVTAAGAAVVLTAVTTVVQSRTDLTSALSHATRGATRRGDRLREGLVIVQMALAFALVVGAALFVRSLIQVGGVDWGFETRNVTGIQLTPSRLMLDPAVTHTLAERSAARLAALPGVERVAISQTIPLRPSMNAPFRLRGREDLPGVGPGQLGYPTFFAVSPDFFDVMGITLLEGRGIERHDAATSAPVVVIDATMARTFWPSGDAIGQCVMIGPPGAECRTVVGVVEDTRRFLAQPAHNLRYYLPLTQTVSPGTDRYVVVRAGGDPVSLIPSIRRLLSELHPTASAAEVFSMTSLLDPYTRPWRLGTSVFMLFGGMSQAIAAMGLYAVMAFGVAMRRREIGIRTALGASHGRIIWLVACGVVFRVSLAVAGGSAIALASRPWMRGLLFEPGRDDALVFGVSAAAALLTALVASVVPAWRAIRVDPVRALRAN